MSENNTSTSVSVVNEIEERLFALRDEGYAAFQLRLMPGITPDRVIGVRTPEVRSLGKEYAKKPETEAFLAALPHRYYDENNLHGFIVSECRDYEKTVGYIDAFLPYVDNWATCDLLSPKCFKKHRAELKNDILRWIASDRTYTIRFGIEMAMSHFLDEDFSPEFPEIISGLRSEEYYVNMMIAWYFATALTKQWDASLRYLTEKKLAPWVHNKTIQKAVESFRITDDRKAFLKTLKIK